MDAESRKKPFFPVRKGYPEVTALGSILQTFPCRYESWVTLSAVDGAHVTCLLIPGQWPRSRAELPVSPHAPAAACVSLQYFFTRFRMGFVSPCWKLPLEDDPGACVFRSV